MIVIMDHVGEDRIDHNGETNYDGQDVDGIKHEDEKWS